MRVSVEGRRGCGYRKPGGLYLVSFRNVRGCGKFPIPLESCRSCGGGIKPALGWTWIEPAALFAPGPCSQDAGRGCALCLSNDPPERCGLIWIGRSFYPTPADFLREAAEVGISRRIAALPRDFVPGGAVVFLAHRDALADADASKRRGIIAAMRPRAELVVDPENPPDELEQRRLRKRGIEPVIVKRAPEPENGELPFVGGAR